MSTEAYRDRAVVVPSLVADAQRGDRESLGRIFDVFHLPIYRYVLVRIRSAPDAEDIAADTFVAAFAAIGRFRWQGLPFEAWLFRIARSKISDHQRRARRRSTTSDIAAVAPELLPREEDVAVQVVRRDEHRAAIAAMTHLSQDQQDVLALRFFAGLTLHETAEAMGRSSSAVKQLQFRAVTALRREIGGDR
ncbi:MAG: sigma-70 family RNA polymerase sigma factor [Chloroflexota bacterium]